MAGFKTHSSVGIATGFILMIGSYMLGIITSLTVAVLVFVNTAIGSFLPDLDSDSGVPVKILFGFYALVAAGIAFFITYNLTNENVIASFAAPLIAFLLFNFALPPLFKKLTKHRGMFHSIPAILISFLFIFLILNLVNIPILDRFIMAFAVAIGYFSHLLLDEIFSTQILSGKFKPKKSLGTALKFASQSKKMNIAIYILFFILLALNFPMLLKVVKLLKTIL